MVVVWRAAEVPWTAAPVGDRALIALHLRHLFAHPPLTGMYSRYGWYHPGPALYYALVLPYRLLGQRSWSLAMTTLMINVACLAAMMAIVHRYLGATASALTSLVSAAEVEVLGTTLLTDYWNPSISILPFAVALLFCCGGRPAGIGGRCSRPLLWVASSSKPM
jgi:hypothetical protein